LPINQAWYNLQSTRAYPLDDTASAIDDAGKRLVSDIIVDCVLRFPGDRIDRAYLAGVTVTPRLVTALIANPANNLIAAINIVQPVVTGRMYQLDPLVDGVGGWLVFGDGVNSVQSYRFSSGAQSQLLARCASAYATPNVPSIAKADQTSLLSGVVNFKDGADVAATIEPIFVLGQLKKAVVFRLAADNTQRNALAEYNSPCELRPESKNCAHAGVEFINSVPPDCHGNINIVFSGLVPGAYQHCAGVTLDYNHGLAALCQIAKANIRPTQHDPCLSLGSSLFYDELLKTTISSINVGPPPPVVDPGTCINIPVCYTLGNHTATGFIPRSGLFGFLNYHRSGLQLCAGALDFPSSVYAAIATYQRNASIFESCQTDLRHQKLTVDVSVQKSTAAKNAHVIFGWNNPGGIEQYFVASLDFNDNTVKFLRYNGSGFVVEASSRALGIVLTSWYRFILQFSSVDASAGTASLIVLNIDGVAVSPTAGLTLRSSLFNTAALQGFCGVGSDSALAYFEGFKLELI
jgi:hypothetical protein